MFGKCWYFQGNVSSNEGWILRAVLDVVDQWNRRRWIKHFKLLSFACDFVVLGGSCGGGASCVGGSGRLWRVEQEDGGGRFENLRGKCNSPQVKIFSPGELLGLVVFVERECGKGGGMLMWVLYANWF